MQLRCQGLSGWNHWGEPMAEVANL